MGNINKRDATSMAVVFSEGLFSSCADKMNEDSRTSRMLDIILQGNIYEIIN